MTPLERYIFTMINAELAPLPNPDVFEIEVVGWATDWHSIHGRMRIAELFRQIFGRVGTIESAVDPAALTAALGAAQAAADAASASAGNALTEAASAAAGAQAASASAGQANTNALAAMGHAQAAAASAAVAAGIVAAMEDRLTAIENRLSALEG